MHATASTAALPASEPLRIALAQVAPRLGDLARNLALHVQALAAAAEQAADLVVFPELSLTGYALRDMVPEVALRPDGEAVAQVLSAAGGADVVFGLVEHAAHDRFYNSALYGSAGRVVEVHRKVYLPTYGLFDEQRYFARGERFRAVTTRFGKVGLLVCEDLWHLSSPLILAAQEIDLLICICNSPARGVETEDLRTRQSYDRMCRCYAELLGVAVVLVNRAGAEDGLCFWGGSLVAGPDGGIVGQAPLLDEAVHVVTFDRADLRRRRVLSPLARDERWRLTIEELQHARRARD